MRKYRMFAGTIAISIGAVLLLLAIGAPPAAAQTPPGRRVALVIGNGAYQHTTALANPANDARDMVAALGDLGFEVVSGVDLGKRDLEAKVREFAGRLGQAETAVFFYAGHGLQIGGSNYLVPVDARLAGERDLEFDAVKVEFVLRQMELERETKTTIVFLDACRDNPLARNLARTMGTRSAAVGQGLAQIQSGVGTFVSFSTQPGNVALDGQQSRNSPFTAALAKHIRTPGKTLNGLMIDVRRDVLAATGGKQVPWDHSALTGEFFFAPGGAAAMAPAAPQVMPGQDVTALQERIRRMEDQLKQRETPPAVAALPSAPAAPPASPPTGTNFVQRTGNEITEGARLGVGRAENPTMCRARCEETAQCVGFQWHTQSRSCVLFSSVEQRDTGASAQYWTSGVRADYRGVTAAIDAAPTATGAYDLRRDGMLQGTELSNTRVPRVDECQAACTANGQCAGFQFEANSNVCLLFSRVTFRTRAAGWHAGVKIGAGKP